MLNARTFVALVFGAALLAPGLDAQDLLPARPLAGASLAQYRNFALTSDLATVSTAAGVAATTVKVIHQRPAVLQELEWRPSRWNVGSTLTSTDPVEQIVFSFYNDQLFRIVVDYARDRTEGMTDADMVEAIAAVYGAPGKRVVPAARVASQVETESGTPVARWGDAGHTIVLYRTTMYGDGLRLIVTDSTLDRLARKAAVDAERIEQLDAPRAELARQKKEHDDGQAASEKARVVNKAVFRP